MYLNRDNFEQLNKEEDKDQESIQPSTTTDPENYMGKRQKNTRKHYTQERQ